MPIRDYLIRIVLVFTLLFQLSWPLPTARAQTPSKPDIIVFMMDDLSVKALQAVLHFEKASGLSLLKNFHTYIEPFATDFTESFVSNPVCCPSRATYLTGQYSHNHKVFTNKTTNGTLLYLNENATLATAMQTAGYRTAHVGKYLNGYGSNITAKSTTELNSVRYLARTNPNVGSRALKLEPTYRPPGWSEWFSALDPTTYCTSNYILNENGKLRAYLKSGEVREISSLDALAAANGNVYQASNPLDPSYGDSENYQTDIYSRRALDIIQRRETLAPTSPLFLTIMPLAPHVEECRFSNDRFLGTPAEDHGPELIWETYSDLYSERIRPPARHQGLLNQIEPIAETYLRNQGPDFSVPKLSFNESDMADKPIDIQQKVPVPLGTDEIQQLRGLLASQMASLVAVDEMIGQVLGRLYQLGRLSNAMIIFTGDNGYAFGEHRLTSKLMAYEETAKVPLYLTYTGGQAQKSSRLVLNNDLAPTIAALGGATLLTNPDGRSLLPLLANPSTTAWRRQILMEHFSSAWEGDPLMVVDKKSLFAIRTDSRGYYPNSKLIEHYEGVQYQKGYYLTKPPTDILGYPTTTPLPGFLWSGTKYFDELYELNQDPDEIDNRLFDLASQSPAESQRRLQVQAQLKESLAKLKACKGSACRTAEDQWIPKSEIGFLTTP